MDGRTEQSQILLMLSGGIDSTYLLYDYLRNTDSPVHAHHISLRNQFHGRWKAEDVACERIVAWCRTSLRDLDYSSSRFDLDFPWTGWDSDLQLLVASKVAPNLGHRPVSVALGWCAHDLERWSVRDRHERGVYRDLWHALCESADTTVDLDRTLATPLVDLGLAKSELIARMPPELLGLTWSCRHPTIEDGVPRPCGTCHACTLREVATAEALRGAP